LLGPVETGKDKSPAARTKWMKRLRIRVKNTFLIQSQNRMKLEGKAKKRGSS
jgi:hypothetical protein